MSEERDLLHEVRIELLKSYAPEAVDIWLESHNPWLGTRPIDAINAGEGEKVLLAATALAEGAFM